MRTARVRWPEGRRFAFTIIDDTDHATLQKIQPIYSLLSDLGILITKTIWVLPAPEDPRWGDGDTLEDPRYRAFVVALQGAGFEIALHGVRGTSSTREVVLRGLERYVEILGRPPRIHVNHSQNADNLYWGEARLPRWRRALRLHRAGPEASLGHDPRSPYFWGDLCESTIDYVRALCFTGIDTLACDPFMPYHDDRYPLVKAWFSCSDAANVHAFRRLLAPQNLRSLAEGGGACIVYTHFGSPGFVTEKGEVAEDVRDTLVALSGQPGWFRPASDVLDFLRGSQLRRLNPLQRLRLEARARWDRLLAR
jgi:hypothetical protein